MINSRFLKNQSIRKKQAIINEPIKVIQLPRKDDRLKANTSSSVDPSTSEDNKSITTNQLQESVVNDKKSKIEATKAKPFEQTVSIIDDEELDLELINK